MIQETVSIETEGMMELFVSIEEGLPHYLQQWVSTAVKSLMQMVLPNDYVCTSVSLIDHYCIIVHSTIDVLLAAVDSSPKIELLIAGQTYRNNSVIELSEGFETNQSLSLVCATEKRPCCNSSVIGEWYYPNNMTAVPNVEAGNTFYTSRGDDGTVHLHLRNITTFLSNTTQFCCELPNINNLNQRLCVHLSEYNYVILLITVHDIIHNADMDPTIFEEEEMSTTVYPGGFIQVRLLGIADCYNWVVRSLL